MYVSFRAGGMQCSHDFYPAEWIKKLKEIDRTRHRTGHSNLPVVQDPHDNTLWLVFSVFTLAVIPGKPSSCRHCDISLQTCQLSYFSWDSPIFWPPSKSHLKHNLSWIYYFMICCVSPFLNARGIWTVVRVVLENFPYFQMPILTCMFHCIN